MKESKTFNKVLSVFMVVFFFAAFIISVSARMWDSSVIPSSWNDHLAINWSAGAPFLVLCLIGLGAGSIKLVRYVKLNGKNLKGNGWAIAELVILIIFAVSAILSCLSLAMYPKIIDLPGSFDINSKVVAPIVTSVIAFVAAGTECAFSFGKLDK